MFDLGAVIAAREIDVGCRQCGWTEPRALSWLDSKRHMNCPKCDSLIVLNTSDVRRAITQQRQQLTALHGQLVNLLGSSNEVSKPAQCSRRSLQPRPALDLELAQHFASARRSRRG
jgi:hypothetical protein